MELTTNEQLQSTPAPSKAKQIVSMCLSIAGLAMVTVGGIGLSSYLGGGTLNFSLEALALSIVGFILSKQGLAALPDSKFLRLGKSLGIAGIIASAVTLVLTILFLIVFFGIYFLAIFAELGTELGYYL